VTVARGLTTNRREQQNSNDVSPRAQTYAPPSLLGNKTQV